jgi:hypothetical protein
MRVQSAGLFGVQLSRRSDSRAIASLLDPEAVEVWPVVYFPVVLEMIRRLIETSVRQLEYEEVRRLLCRSAG